MHLCSFQKIISMSEWQKIIFNLHNQASIIAIATVGDDKHAAFHAWPVWLTGHLHPPIMAVLIIPHILGRHRRYSGWMADELTLRWTLLVWQGCATQGQPGNCHKKSTSHTLRMSLRKIPAKVIFFHHLPFLLRPLHVHPHPPLSSPFPSPHLCPPSPLSPIGPLMQLAVLPSAEVVRVPNNYPIVL